MSISLFVKLLAKNHLPHTYHTFYNLHYCNAFTSSCSEIFCSRINISATFHIQIWVNLPVLDFFFFLLNIFHVSHYFLLVLNILLLQQHLLSLPNVSRLRMYSLYNLYIVLSCSVLSCLVLCYLPVTTSWYSLQPMV